MNAGGFAVGHNGNLTNGLTLRSELVRNGAMMQSTTDTEVILHLVAQSKRNRFIERFIEALRAIEGAYSLVALTNKKLVGARDPLGIRPLVLGELDGCPILASETCALDIIGAKYIRDIENGEVIVFDESGVAEPQAVPADDAAPLHLRIHLFLAAGFSRRRTRGLRHPQGDGRAVGAREQRAGRRRLFRCRIQAFLPRIGYSRTSGIPFELGIIRNHYVGRTFIQPTQSIRELGVRMKHSANRCGRRRASASC